MESKPREFDFKFPTEIKRAIHGLDNEQRWRILEVLIKGDELPYTHIHNKLGLKKKGLTTYHLNELSKAGIIQNFSKDEIRDRYSSYYEVSPFGKDLINGLLESLKPAKVTMPKMDSKDTWAITMWAHTMAVFTMAASLTADAAETLKETQNELRKDTRQTPLIAA